MIPPGIYRPDAAEGDPAAAANIRNVLMAKGADGIFYRPHPSLGIPAVADALAAAPRGGLKVVTSSGTNKTLMGTAASIYSLGTDFAWTEEQGSLSLPAGETWGRVQFLGQALWSNSSDGLLAYDIETPSGVNSVSGAPKFKHLAKVFDSVLGTQSDGDPRTFHLSATNSYSEYVKDGARYVELTDGDEIMGAGELSQGYAVVFQRTAIHILTRVNDRTRFTRTQLSNKVGAASAESIVTVNGASYFLSDTGFQAVTPAGLRNIGKDKVNATFVASLVGDLKGVQGIYDPIFNRILWRFPPKVGSATVSDQILVYDLNLDEFGGLLDEQTTWLLAVGTTGYNADNAGDLGNVDTVPYGPDSRFWKGGERRVLALDEDFKAGYFDGPSLAATVETSSLVTGTSNLISSLTALTDAEDATVALGVKDRLADGFTWKDGVAITASGRCPVRGRGKVARARIEVPAGSLWGFVRGVDFPQTSTGGPR